MTQDEMIAREFPDFDLATLPNVPEGFVCCAWRSDTMPLWYRGESARAGSIMLAVDFADQALREFPGDVRFHLHIVQVDDSSPEPLFSSDRWSDIEAALRMVARIQHLGLGFHPDTSPSGYVNGCGERVYSDEEAAAFYDDLNAIADPDPCEFGIKVWRALGLIEAS